MTIKDIHSLYLKFPNPNTDTRKIETGCFFFALKGENFNGNTFAKEALNNGAAYVIIDEEAYDIGEQTILVNNVLEILQQLATYHRNYCNARVIALTGSNGKTTTKELINVVLSKTYRTIATKGNLNNHIGVPLTLLSIKPDTEYAIVEMGANHLKEIDFLCNLAQPDYGYVTNFGKAHLEGFGSEDGVIKGKSELYDYLIKNKKSIFLNADDPIQKEKLENYIKKIDYSTEDHTFYNIKYLEANPFVTIEVDNIKITTQLIGSYNFDNCCAAILMGKYFNVPLENVKRAIEDYVPQNNRSQIIKKNGHQIILDAYNANPTSMEAALKNLNSMNANSKIVFLGDMFELGETATIEHQKITTLVEEMGFEQAYLIGENFYQTQTSLYKFNSFEDLATFLKNTNLPESTCLIKGSRGMALERILNFI